MFTTILRNIALLALALSATACVNTKATPSMLDYSYVPPQYTGAGNTPYGLDDF